MKLEKSIILLFLFISFGSCKKLYFEDFDYVPLKFTFTDSTNNVFVQDSLSVQIKTVIRDPAIGVVEISTPITHSGFETINNKAYKVYSANFASIYSEFKPLYFILKIININNGNVVSAERLTILYGPATISECKKRVCRNSSYLNAFSYNNKTYNVDFEDRYKTVLLEK